MVNVKFDGPLMNIFSTMGTKSNNDSWLLSQREIEDFYRNHKYIQKIVDILPEDALAQLPRWNISEGDSNALLSAYLDIEAIGQPLEELTISEAIATAAIYGRLYGDGFLFIGLNDGKDNSEPVDLTAIKSIDWVATKHRYQVGLDYTRDSYHVYIDPSQQSLGNLVFHKSRVIRIPGIKLHGQMIYDNGGYNDSVIQSVYREYLAYKKAVISSSEMISSHSVFKYGLKNLKSLVLSGKESALKQRFSSLIEGLSTVGGLLFDKDTEDAEFITRSYGGVDRILKQLQDWFVGAADMPRGKIFGTAASNSLSDASEGERWAWNEYVARYQQARIYPAHHKLALYILASQGISDISYNHSYPAHYQMSEKQIAEIKKLNADTDKIYFDMGLDSEIIIHDRFGGAEYGSNIVLPKNWTLNKS